MIQKLPVHPPTIEMCNRDRLFKLRKGHTNSVPDMIRSRSLPHDVLHSFPDLLRAAVELGHSSRFLDCRFHSRFSQWNRCFWAFATSLSTFVTYKNLSGFTQTFWG